MANSGKAAPAEPAGHVTGVGGIFFKAKDPKALAAWYRDVLGLPTEAWGGAALRYDAPKHPPALAWNAFPASTKYFAPSTSAFMINYAVDDMDALLARVRAKGVTILKHDDSDPNGRFAWILDPEGNKIELWEPKHKKSVTWPSGANLPRSTNTFGVSPGTADEHSATYVPRSGPYFQVWKSASVTGFQPSA